MNFQRGDIVRYGEGPTALMRVSNIVSNGPQGAYCHGSHVLGGVHGAMASDLRAATQEDLETWARVREPATPLEWVQVTFGPVARNRDERVMRLLEEVMELAQAEGISADKVRALCVRVFTRDRSEPLQELAQVAFTLDALAELLGVNLRAMIGGELHRVRSKPAEYWAQRHQAKADAGLANLSPVP